MATLPLMAPFPEAAWRNHLDPAEWQACLVAWCSLAIAHLSLSSSDFVRISCHDDSLSVFLSTFMAEMALSPELPSLEEKQLRREAYLLSYKILENEKPPKLLLTWNFLADLCKVYGKGHGTKIAYLVWKRHSLALEASMGTVKNFLIEQLDSGLKGDLALAEIQLKRLNQLIHASAEASAFFLAGSDFLDSLISCYKLMNPPLRKAIVSTLYLCLVGLTEGEKPNFSSLTDQLYSLQAAADAHKAGPTNVNDSLVAELVTVTPILKQVQQRLEASKLGLSRAKAVISALDKYKKAGVTGRPLRLIKRKIDKGKGPATNDGRKRGSGGQLHVHRMSLISQVQDLFPDLGSGFIVKLLDEYQDNVEEVISHLLEESLPAHLKNADRAEELDPSHNAMNELVPDLAPHSPTPQLPNRRNIYDDDDLDQLAVDTSKLHFGRRNPDQTADDVLQDRSNAPNKAAILSALAAFDSDDDERDDTYDTADVGGTVDSATPGNNPEESSADMRDAHDESLFHALKTTPKVFDRDAATRRGKERMALKEETGMTDEAIEGWALMLSRDPRQLRRLEAKYSTFSGGQRELALTAWRADGDDSDGGQRGRGGFKGRGRGRGRGGNVAGPTGEKDTEVARQRKEANKGSRANHNRRDQRARKMARGGFPG